MRSVIAILFITSLILLEFCSIPVTQHTNDTIDEIPPNIIEPMPFHFDGGDTLYISDSNIIADSLSGKLWINLLLDSLGNKLSFAIIAYDDYITDKRICYTEYSAFDFYKDSLNYSEIYSDSLLMMYSSIEKYINQIPIEKTGQANNNKFYGFNFYIYIMSQSALQPIKE